MTRILAYTPWTTQFPGKVARQFISYRRGARDAHFQKQLLMPVRFRFVRFEFVRFQKRLDRKWRQLGTTLQFDFDDQVKRRWSLNLLLSFEPDIDRVHGVYKFTLVRVFVHVPVIKEPSAVLSVSRISGSG